MRAGCGGARDQVCTPGAAHSRRGDGEVLAVLGQMPEQDLGQQLLAADTATGQPGRARYPTRGRPRPAGR
jgi:hypothetical protein